MPLYEFECPRCGHFDAWLRVSQAGQSTRCPTCTEVARRVYTPPGLLRSSPGLRRARDIEEKSAQEPEVVTAPSGHPLSIRHPDSAAPPWTVAG
jgi:putative FmdB family regulatory protein